MNPDGRSASSAQWDELRAEVGGEVIVAGKPGYEAARTPPLARYEGCRPEAIVLATTAADVAATIGFARRAGLRATPRSGGHCFAGRSSSGDIIIDVTPMNSVSIVDDVATVGAGARLGELYDALSAHDRTIPAGCGTSVGIAGLTLGGGLGLLGRTYGFTCDRLLGARVVLADGRIVDCDEHQDAELFWALRGAGGGQFGVVTELRFATVPEPMSTCFHLEWPAAHAADIVAAWQEWAPTAPDAVEAHLRVTDAIHLIGTVHGSDAPLDPFVDRVGVSPDSEFRQEMRYREVKRHLSGLGSAEEPGHMFSKSEFFRRPLPREAIEALLSHAAPELNFTPLGGAYNRVSSDATAFAHREELFMIEHVITVKAGEASTARDRLGRSWATVHPWGSGRVYPNFPDPDLVDWADAYHGTNVDRLLSVKRKYDPDNWFRFPQSLGS